MMHAEPVIETRRLVLRPAELDDAPFILMLWRDPRVMRWVGYPWGLPTTEGEIREKIARISSPNPEGLLVIEDRSGSRRIGQCKLGAPDSNGISEPDIKLAPAEWGQGYGAEAWASLIDTLFRRTDCRIVQGTPNVHNAASIAMQERAGMRRVGEGRFEFPPAMRTYTESVPYYVYQIARAAWATSNDR